MELPTPVKKGKKKENRFLTHLGRDFLLLGFWWGRLRKLDPQDTGRDAPPLEKGIKRRKQDN